MSPEVLATLGDLLIIMICLLGGFTWGNHIGYKKGYKKGFGDGRIQERLERWH